MTGGRQETFADFARDAGPALLRTAVLLTASASSGRELAETTLARASARWSAVGTTDDPAATVRRHMVGSYLGPVRRFARTEQVVDSVPVRAVPAQEADDDLPSWARTEQLRLALLRLDHRLRAAVVLRVAEGLGADVVAALVRRPGSWVREQVDAAYEELSPGPGRGELAARLAALADELTWPDDTIDVPAALQRRRRQLWRTRGLAVGASVAVAALIVGVLVAAPDRTDTTTTTAAPTTSPAPTPAPTGALELQTAIAALDAPVVLSSPAGWGAGGGATPDDTPCPSLVDRLGRDLGTPVAFTGGVLPAGCGWRSVPDPALTTAGPPYRLSLSFVGDRTTTIDILSSLPDPVEGGTCVQGMPPGGGVLLLCAEPDAEPDELTRLVLTVPDSRGLGFWVLSARAAPQAVHSATDALVALTGAAEATYG